MENPPRQVDLVPPTISKSEATYKSYLLRLWRDNTGSVWRVTLMDVHAPYASQHFSDVPSLLAFLDENPSAQ